LNLYDGEKFYAVAVHAYTGVLAERLRQGFRGSDNPVTRALLEGARSVHISDLAEIDHPVAQAAVEFSGLHTALFVPLRRDDTLLGMISAGRQEIRPFSDKEIALLENFAAQAVIAMENARLITETREALDQQTATAEVLQVINSSPGDLTPVFDAMLQRATRLCDAAFGIANIYDGERFQAAALHQVPAPLAELWLSAAAPVPGPNSPLTRIARGEDVVHIKDFAATPTYRGGEPRHRAMVELGGAHSYVAVALRKKDGELLER
jgi:predicted component of type VI protein secretion system